MGAAQPERTCLGCGLKAPKDSLVRLVARDDGRLRVSPTAPGRGAYVHGGCVEAPQAPTRLAGALRTRLDPGEIARLRTDIEGNR